MEMVKFTNSEWEIINHRLEAPDAIAECFIDSDWNNYSHDLVADRAGILSRGGQHEINWNSKLDMDILEDCCLGCVMFSDMQDAVLIGEVKKGWAMNAYKAAKSIERKTGWEVTI